MGQAASQIEDHIESKREDLGSNLRELEDKVKSATDWHHQFGNRPLVFLGLAFGGGAVLSSVFGRSSGRRHYSNYTSDRGTESTDAHAKTRRAPSPAMQKAYAAWENVQGALVGIAATKVKDYADGIIPGFADQYRQTEAEHRHQP